MRRLMVLTLATLAGCATYGGGACKTQAKQLCEVCPKNDFSESYCACIDKGTLVQSDFTDGYQAVLGFESDSDAAMLCSQWLNEAAYPGPDAAAACKRDIEYLDEYEAQACEDLGWTSD